MYRGSFIYFFTLLFMKNFLLVMIVSLPLVLAWCGLIKNKDTTTVVDTPDVKTVNSAAVEVWDTVFVDYVGTLEDGTLFDTSLEDKAKAGNKYNAARKYEPLKFVAGGGQMIVWFDEWVMGMKENETKTLTLPPEKAYGSADDPKYNVLMNVETFKLAGIAPEVGKTYDFGGQKARIISLSGETQVMVNFAPELAGKTLVFEITVKKIEKPSVQ